MNKEKFLKELEHTISSLPKDYVHDIINDYIEYFEDGKLDGKSENEIISELGNIKDIRDSILSEYYIENPSQIKNLSTFIKALKTLKIIGAGIFSLLFGIPIIGSILLLYLALYLLSFSLILTPIALIIHLFLPNLPINFGTHIIWQEFLITTFLFVLGLILLMVLEKIRNKLFSYIFKFLIKNKHPNNLFSKNK